jgi:hypothetical protein
MASFNYSISITGACGSNLGAASILPSGGTPPYTIQWVNPNLGTDSATILPSIRSGLSSGTYVVRLNDSSLPTNAVFDVNIPVSSGVCAIVAGVQNTTCGEDNGSITGSSTSNYSSTNFYLYTNDGAYVTSAITNTDEAIFQNLSAGTYYLLVEDLGGCTGASSTIIVEDSTPFDYGLYVVPNSSCGTGAIGKIYVTGITGTPPFTYVWSNAKTTSSITGLTNGNYSVTVTDASGCVLEKSAQIVDVPVVGFGNFIVTQPTCFASDGVVVMVITGGTAPYYYSASTGVFEVSYSQTYTLSGLSSGPLSITVTDSAFCTFTQTVQLSTPNGMDSVSINGTNSSCSNTDGSIQVNVVGGSLPYTYTLIKPGGNTQVIASNNTTVTFDSLSGGTYSVTVQDSSGCNFTDTVTIITENLYDVTTSITGTTCGQNNGFIGIQISTGGTEPYNYLLDGVVVVSNTIQTGVTLTNVSSGVHTITVTDYNGCSQSQNVFVDSSEPVSYSLYTTSCGSGSEGTITAFISSGVPPFTFTWSDNVAGNPQEIQVSGLTAGTYSVTVVDNNGCSLKRNIDVICTTNYMSYQVYVVGQENFQEQVGTKCGLLEMLNEGFYDLTVDNVNCVLSSATFIASVSVEPLGSAYTSSFFTTTSLLVAPSDNLWYTTIDNLISSIDGIQNVTIDALNNTITIESTPNGPLENQIITIDILIEYEISCES